MLAVAAMAGAQSVFAQLNVPSDGSDGVLNITTNTVIDLSKASYSVWNQNNATNAGNGIYDPAKWAVVFKYSSVNIASNATITFLNHPSHAPVVWLVQSNVAVVGSVSLDGRQLVYDPIARLFPNEPAPGRFRGGAIGALGYGAGYGPNGGSAGDGQGGAYGSTYGNPQAIPLIGGSGSGPGVHYGVANNGPSGGGAVLIAAGGTVTINGHVTANGSGINGSGTDGGTDYSGGGAIRIVANSIQGSGSVSAAVVRTEANSISQNLVITPNTIIVPPGTTPVIWPATNAPTVTVISVNGASAPSDPLAGVLTSSDVNISTNNPVDIMLQAQNFPPSGVVVVRVTPKYANYFNVNASYVSGTFAQSTWKATTTFPNGFCVLQAHATSP